jgi:hypothetical protein
MAEKSRLLQMFPTLDTEANGNSFEGDCVADPFPALWHEDDDEYFAESGFVERFWLSLVLAVLAGWGSLLFVFVSTFGWLVILAVAGIVIAGATAAIILVRTRDGNEVDMA